MSACSRLSSLAAKSGPEALPVCLRRICLTAWQQTKRGRMALLRWLVRLSNCRTNVVTLERTNLSGGENLTNYIYLAFKVSNRIFGSVVSSSE